MQYHMLLVSSVSVLNLLCDMIIHNLLRSKCCAGNCHKCLLTSIYSIFSGHEGMVFLWLDIEEPLFF